MYAGAAKLGESVIHTARGDRNGPDLAGAVPMSPSAWRAAAMPAAIGRLNKRAPDQGRLITNEKGPCRLAGTGPESRLAHYSM
jgi:hypothetical protein